MHSIVKHQSVSINGIQLHLVTAGPETGKLVILLHGFPEFWFGWRKQVDHLVGLGYRVVMPDQRGYGASDKPKAVSAYGIDVLAQDVAAIIAWAGLSSALLVGHDWGAAVAWRTAILFPDKVEKLVILNVPHPDVMQANLRGNWRQTLRSWYIFFFQLPWLPENLLALQGARRLAHSLRSTSVPGTFTSAELEEYQRAWTQPGAIRAMLNWYRAALRAPGERLSRTRRRIRMPCLIIWGAKDRFLGQEMASESLEYCDHGRLELIPDATHWVQHEQAEKVNALLGEFLS